MRTGEIIERIQSLYSKGVKSDDSRLSNRHIYAKIKTVRTRLITQEIKKKQRVSDWNYQTIPCVKLIEVPVHECPCVPPLGCTILRSKNKLPKVLTGFTEDLIQSVTSVDRSLKIDRVNINAVNSQKGNKYTSKKVNYFILNEYLYITTPTKMKVVTIRGLFEDPIEVATSLYDCQGETESTICIDYMDTEFKIDSDMIDTLVEISLQELLVIFSQGVEDITNNTRDSLIEKSK